MNVNRIQQDMGSTAVLVVDIQGDFTQDKSGALAVAGSDGVWLGKVEGAVRQLKKTGFPILATQDWHPGDHISFYTNTPGKAAFDRLELEDRTQIMWPPHCIQGTDKADLLLATDLLDHVVRKGMDPEYDSYSGFFDDGRKATGLGTILKEKGIKELIIFGLATDYCVKFTALDARELGYGVTVVEDLCLGVAPETTAQALEEMAEAGIQIWKTLPLVAE